MMRFLLALLLCLPVAAADTGWVFASAGSSVDYNSGTAWTNPGNIVSQNSTYATCAPAVGDFTDYIRGTFALTIPAGATINGIEVRFNAKRSGVGPDEDSVKIVIGGTAVGTDGSLGSSISGTSTDYVRGGATSLWGLTPTRDQCVATDFGFQVAFVDNDSAVETTSVDSLAVRVYYTEAGATATSGFPLMFLETE